MKIFRNFLVLAALFFVSLYCFLLVGRQTDALEVGVRKPLDVVLTVDISASMGNDSKLTSVRNSSLGFVDNMIAFPPDESYFDDSYHQVGLVAFNTNMYTENLNSDLEDVKTDIETLFVDPSDCRKTVLAMYNAKNMLLSEDYSNSSADKIMILVTDGLPSCNTSGNTVEAAEAMADTMKSSGIRIITVGVGMDIVEDTPTQNTEAEDFVRYLSSSAGDCYYLNQYYFDNPTEELLNCNSISSEDLSLAMEQIFDSVSSAVLNDAAPVVNAVRVPEGPLFSTDSFSLESYSSDDLGFKEFYLMWAPSSDWVDGDWLGDSDPRNRVVCDNLIGVVGEDGSKNITVSTGSIGPFSAGENIKYQVVAVDASNNISRYEESEPVDVYVADAALNIPTLYRNRDNRIYLTIDDPSGAVYSESSFYINIYSDDGNEIENAVMTRVNDGSVYSPKFYYDFNPGCDWSSGYVIDETDHKYADDSVISFYVEAYDTNFGRRDLISSIEHSLENYNEGVSWTNCVNDPFSGNISPCYQSCSNSINDDCDYYLDGQEIIDDDELLCDADDPVVNIYRTDPDEDYYEVYDTDNNVTFNSVAYDSDTVIIRNVISYRYTGSSSWTTLYDCRDYNLDSRCDSDSSKYVDDLFVTLSSPFPASPGTGIEYYAYAVDGSGNNNVGISSIESFVVKSSECYGRSDLQSCLINTSGVCCGGICNGEISDSGYGYSDDCSVQTCQGTEWKLVPNTSLNGVSCQTNEGLDDGCYSFTPSSPAYPFEFPTAFYPSEESYSLSGCEERVYTCSNGFCSADFDDTRREDGCDPSLHYNDFECNAGSCEIIHSWEDATCDTSISFSELFAYDSSGENMTGVPEILDTKSDKVRILGRTYDEHGITSYKLFWRVNGGSWQEKDCGSCATNPSSTPCTCEQEIGPFEQNDFVNYYMWVQDGSPNNNEKFVGSDGGLAYWYYDGKNFDSFQGSDIDTSLHHYWSGSVRVDSSNVWEDQADTVSIIWEGFINLDDNYNFRVQTDDGMNFYLDDLSTPAISAFYNQALTSYYYTPSETLSGWVPVKIKWYDDGSNAYMNLDWKKTTESSYSSINPNNLAAPYTFLVRNDSCYDIDDNYSEDVPSTPSIDTLSCQWKSTEGICCAGYCDIEPTSSSLDEECRVNTCSGMNWIYGVSNILGETKEGDICGALGSCFDYYSGCQSGNKCYAGACVADSSSIQTDTCAGNIFSDYGCLSGSCGLISTGLDCSISSNSDGDSIDCNCDCNNYDVQEKEHSSLEFDNVFDSVNVGKDLIGDSGAFDFWIKPNNITLDQLILHNGNGAGYGPGPEVSLRINAGSMLFYGTSYWSSDPIYSTVASHSTLDIYLAHSIPQGVWTHVVITWGASGAKMYMNGSLVSSDSWWAGAFDKENYGSKFLNFMFNSREGRRFTGYLDDFRVYTRTIYAEEAEDHYNGIFYDDSDLLAYWDFEEGAGDRVVDATGNGYNGYFNSAGVLGHGTYTSSYLPSLTSDAKYGGYAYYFDGSDFVSLPEGIIENSGDATISAWFKTYDSDGGIVTQYDMSSTYGYKIVVDGGYVKGCVGTTLDNCSASGDFDVVNSDFAVNDTEWHYVTMTYNGSKVILYVDGYKRDEKSKSGNIDYYDTYGYGNLVGAQGYKTSSSFYSQGEGGLVGIIDDVRIYDRSMGEEEVYNRYRGIVVDESNLVGLWAFDNIYDSFYAYDDSDSGPDWHKYYYGITEDVVPDVMKVCSDSKDNNCNSYYDEDEFTCDGNIDYVGMTLTTTESEDDLFDGGTYVEVDDIDAQDPSKNMTITGEAFDRFGVWVVALEWTTDNWETSNYQYCGETDDSSCKICVEGGDCKNESSGSVDSSTSTSITDNNKIWLLGEWVGSTLQILDSEGDVEAEFEIVSNSTNQIFVDDWGGYSTPSVGTGYKVVSNGDVLDISELYAEQVIEVKTCAWDLSGNYNFDCTNSHYIKINDSNLAPQLSNLRIIDPADICNDGLDYKLVWDYDDFPYGEEDTLEINLQSYYTLQIKENSISDWDSSEVVTKQQTTGVHFFETNDSNFIESSDPDFTIEYDKVYNWRVKVADSSPNPYRKESSWYEGPDVVTPEHRYPSVDFSVDPNCVALGSECEEESCSSSEECSFGETIRFYSSSQLFADCLSNSDCQTSSGVICGGETENICSGCNSDSDCSDKFGAGWSCSGGVCQQSESFSCSLSDDNCLARDFAKCSDDDVCTICDDDSQCKKFNTGDTYYCSESVCVSYEGVVTEHSCSEDNDCRVYNTGDDFVCNGGACERYSLRQWTFGDSMTSTVDSTEPNPEKIYVKSEEEDFLVTLKVQDIFGNYCSKSKYVLFGGERYPKWNEVSPNS